MIILSHFRQDAPASLANHRRYANRFGYVHRYVDASQMSPLHAFRVLHRYEVLLHILREAPDGEIVLLLSEDAVILSQEVRAHVFMQERDILLVQTAAHGLPQVDVQFWRNTHAVRQTVLNIVKQCRAGGQTPPPAEAGLFDGLEIHHYMTPLANMCVVMGGGYNYDPQWVRVPTFALSLDDQLEQPNQKGVVGRFRNVLVEHINQCQAAGLPYLRLPQYECVELEPEAERATYNPGHAIAIVTLFTPNVSVYARIAERNFRRYADRHGYTLYVHRDLPKEIGLQASANWYKPWLLHGYLKHHDWVIWLDADVLIADQQRALESLLCGRELLLAHDVGQWEFNAGVMGFKNTPRNEAALCDIMKVIEAMEDRSTVYAGNGDQYQFIRGLQRADALTDDAILDLVDVNTPWMFRSPGNFIVHYFGMWYDLRALMMAYDDAHPT